MARPTLTGVKLRYQDPIRYIVGRVDPAYGVPDQHVPMAWDANTSMYRPFSSILAAGIADAVANFRGFSDGYVQPQRNEEVVFVKIVQSGVVEVLLDVAADVHTETWLTATAGTVVSDDTFTEAADEDIGILKVMKTCSCPEPMLQPCPPAFGAATLIAGDETGSASEAAVYSDRRTAWAYFDVNVTKAIVVP